jgi:hypothetical protein
MSEEYQPTVLDINFDDVYEEEILPADTETQLRIIKAEVARGKSSGRLNLHVVLESVEHPTMADVHTYFSLPQEDDDAKSINRMKKRLQIFYEACGVDTTGPIDITSLAGQTVWVIVGVDSDPKYGDRNTIQRFISGA